MLSVKQFKLLNSNGTHQLARVVRQMTNSSRFGVCSTNCSNCVRTLEKYNTTHMLRPSTPNFIMVSHFYRNYEYHPSRIVRAYRKTRTWLTDHFVISEKRFENAYSFSFLVVASIALIVSTLLNLQLGGEAGGLDVDKTNASKEISETKK